MCGQRLAADAVETVLRQEGLRRETGWPRKSFGGFAEPFDVIHQKGTDAGALVAVAGGFQRCAIRVEIDCVGIKPPLADFAALQRAVAPANAGAVIPFFVYPTIRHTSTIQR